MAQFPAFGGPLLWLQLVAIGLAGLTKIWIVRGPTNNSNYDLSLIIFGFTLLELGRPMAVWVVLAAGLFAWAWHRDYWYINAFNIGMWVISVSAAGLAYDWISIAFVGSSLGTALGIVVATLAFTLVNHLMLGVVILLANGEKFSESGAFDLLILTIDITLFALGALAALIWKINPYATLLIGLPVYLIYLTLRMPALQRRAESDSKTGLFNARHFSQTLKKELDRADRFDRPLTVVMSDLDFFSQVNNTYGHLAGDDVLIGVAKILRQSVREYDMAARFGGEEFACLLLEITPEQALARVEALRQQIEAADFQVSTHPQPIKVTMSFGISGRQRSGQTVEELIHQADMAVYEAKQTGRNRVCLYKNS